MPAPVPASTSAATGTAGSFSVTKPSGTGNGDQVVMFIIADSSATINSVAGGSTWSSMGSVSYGISGTISINVYTKTAGGSEPVSYTVTLSVSANFICIVQRVTGGNSPDAGVNSNSGTGQSETTGSYTTTVSNELVLCCFADTTAGAITLGGSLTDLSGNQTVPATLVAHLGYVDEPTATTNSQSASTSPSVRPWAAVAITIPPGAAPFGLEDDPITPTVITYW